MIKNFFLIFILLSNLFIFVKPSSNKNNSANQLSIPNLQNNNLITNNQVTDNLQNFSNNTLWGDKGLIPSINDNVKIDSGFNIILDKISIINSLIINKNSSLLVKENLFISDNLKTENGSSFILDSPNYENSIINVGGDATFIGNIYVNTFFNLFTNKTINIYGTLNLNGIYFVNSFTKLSGHQYGSYGSVIDYRNITEFYQNSQIMDHGLVLINPACDLLLKSSAFTFISSKMENNGNNLISVDNSGLILNNSSIELSNVTIDLKQDSMINCNRNSFIEIKSSIFKKNNSSFVVQHNSKSLLLNTDLRFYNMSQILLYNDSTLDFTKGTMQLFDSYLNIYNGSVLTLNGELESFKCYNKSSVEISHLGTFIIKGQLNLFDSSSIKCKKGSILTINGTLVHNQNSFINSTLADINLFGDLLLKDKSFVQSDRSNFNIMGNLILEDNSTALKLKNSTFLVPGSVIIKSSMLLDSSYMFIKGNFISNNKLPSNFTNSRINVSGDVKLNGVLSFNRTNIVTYSNFLIRGEIIGNKMDVQSSGHFEVGKNASFLCNQCILDISLDGEFVYDSFSIIKLNATKINNRKGIVRSFGTIHIIRGSSIDNTGTFEHSSNIFFGLSPNGMLKDNNLNSSSEEYEFIEKAIISNKGIWRCIENEAKDDNVIELPFYNNGDLEIHGTSHTEFKYLHQEKGSINLLDGGSIGSNTSIHLNYGSILGNGTIHGNINSSNGEIGHLFELNDLLINGNLHFNSNSSRIVINIDHDQSFSKIQVNKDIVLNQGGAELIFVIHQEMTRSGELEFLRYNQIMGGDFDKIRFLIYDPITLTTKHQNDLNDINGCNAFIKKGHRSLSLLFSSCTPKTLQFYYKYIFLSTFMVLLSVVSSVIILKRHFIKTKYMYWRDRSRESRYIKRNNSNNSNN
ncbi:hypothetical protein DICPUDRAFT_31764 [Dictyostelium purpureum]|uniref:Auto-transporter adhesin head GIN domain-containing protein n=1 Tax=Dictyostelium purpureum TaxID=5786 RepID=F0ZHU2_DICPU|nr:uncharacterized protein DICPUDRAFT_31764 [Dictyostelium purpureum]EGC36471.1 hypothetical protein DICPUDRAFT_31764 [Dictyostelium purpureum]|eukprot:XP_003286984.1 hypothetical protein DICPUDRAFT_31764 [Dictyostelium purpureum]